MPLPSAACLPRCQNSHVAQPHVRLYRQSGWLWGCLLVLLQWDYIAGMSDSCQGVPQAHDRPICSKFLHFNPAF